MTVDIEENAAQTGRRSVAFVRDMLGGIDKELQDVKRELLDAQAGASQVSGELVSLKKRLVASEERGDMLEAELEESADLRKALEDTVADAQARIQKMAHQNESVAALEELIAELKRDNQAFSKKLQVDSEEIVGLIAQLASERELREALSVNLDVARRVIDEQKQALAKAQPRPPD